MSSEIAISVCDISKHHLMFARPEDRLKQMVVPRLQRLFGRPVRRYYRDFAALKGISFDVRRGETVGIVGRNGSGKSTLLQIICGTLQPSSGSVSVNGRVAALLELGAGFNPEFTGRENAFLNAAILGLSHKEIEDRFDAIAAFADIGEFIDQPVKTYSSGMYVRLAFATAINVDPDILVVDEALAVGDEAFQRKCFARIEQIKERGGTILFVSHGAQTIVQLCDRAILLDQGEKLLEGTPKRVTTQYLRLANADPQSYAEMRRSLAASDAAAQSLAPESSGVAAAAPNLETDGFDASLRAPARVEYAERGAEISNVRITDDGGQERNLLVGGRRYALRYTVTLTRDCHNIGFGFTVRSTSGIEIAGAGTRLDPSMLIGEGFAGQVFDVEWWIDTSLTPGPYFVTAGVSAVTQSERHYLNRIVDGYMFRILPEADSIATGLVDLRPRPNVTLRVPAHA